MYRRLLIIVSLMMFSGFLNTHVLADEAAIKMKVPTAVAAGSVITVKLEITHDGNNFIHHVDEVTVTAGEEEIKRWEFGMFDKPESENFVLEFEYTVDREIELTARANCNLHGSKGPQSLKITINKGE